MHPIKQLKEEVTKQPVSTDQHLKILQI